MTAVQHDVREPLPYPDGSFDACYSHMLFCMALTEAELRSSLGRSCACCGPAACASTPPARRDDPDFGKGTHHGEGLYESGGFIVHFFSAETVERLAEGYEIVEVDQFEEGTLPRRLVRVSMRKARRPN